MNCYVMLEWPTLQKRENNSHEKFVVTHEHMKKFFSQQKYKNVNRVRSANRLHRTLIHKKKKKKERKILLNNNEYKPRRVRKHLNSFTYLTAPKEFSFVKNPEPTIDLINKLIECLNKRQKVYIKLKKVESISNCAIIVLLSKLKLFQKQNVRFKANRPKNVEVQRVISNSGFFNFMHGSGKDDPKDNTSKSAIFSHNNSIVKSELGKRIIESASETIWNNKKRCPGVQKTLIECMANTHNHAKKNISENKERWWISVRHHKKKKIVSFAFVDYGIGIIESLKNKPLEIKDLIRKLTGTNMDSPLLIRKILNGEVKLSVTGQKKRGRGLRGIFQAFQRNQLEKLIIITNDVFADVENDKFVKLNEEFSGTFLYWELHENSQNFKWQI